MYIYIYTCNAWYLWAKELQNARVLFVLACWQAINEIHPSIHRGASWKLSMGISFLEPPWVFTLPRLDVKSSSRWLGKMVNLSGSPLFMDIRQVRLDVICLKGGQGVVWCFLEKNNSGKSPIIFMSTQPVDVVGRVIGTYKGPSGLWRILGISHDLAWT